MSLVSDELESPLEELETDLGSATFTFNGVAYPCILSTETRGSDLESGGYVSDVDLTILVRRSQLPSALTVDSTLVTADSTAYTADNNTIHPRPGNRASTSVNGSRVYRVIEIRLVPGGSHYEVRCMDANK
jgi:hypothetical protein